jgi:two-component system NtrC family sensor kinase
MPQRNLLILLAFLVVGPSVAAGPPLTVFEGTGTEASKALLVEVLPDPAGRLTADEALRSTNYIPQTQEVLNLGLGHSTYWLRFSVERSLGAETPVLQIMNPEIDRVDLYRSAGNGHTEHLVAAGLSRTASHLPADRMELAFDLPIDPGSRETFVIKVNSLKQLVLPIVLRSRSAKAEYDARRNLWVGIYLGVMVVMALYNLFIYFSIQDRSYLTYSVYILLVALTQLNFIGLGKSFMWPDNTWWSVKASLLLTLFTAIAAGEFMRRFIDIRRTAPSFDRIFTWFYAFFVMCILAYATVFPLEGYMLAQAGSGLFATFLLICVVAVWRQGSRQAGFFLVAWSLFLVGTVVFVLRDMGILPYNEITTYTMPIGSAIEGVLLSFALADRINVLRREKEQSQALALAAARENERIIREQNTLLELKVKERTRDLEQSNEHLKRTQTQLVSAEKMASLGQLTAGIAHEINNPINFITSNIRPLKRNIADLLTVVDLYRKVEPANASQGLQAVRAEAEEMGLDETITELDEIIDCIAEGSSRTAEIVRGLRNFSRLDEDALKDADLNEGLRSTLALMVPQYRDRVEFDVQLDELPRVECYPGRLNQVFMNILTNGVQAAMAKEGDAMPTIQVRTRTLGDHVEVVIADNGIGMTDEVKARIFDPFYTTKDVGEGTGLGLAIAYGIIEDHHATIAVDSTPGQGTAFRITIPVRHQRTLEKRA